MKTDLSVLLLEDNRYDAELLEHLLDAEGFRFSLRQCDSEESFTRALQEGSPDLIISDFSLPSYNGRNALLLARSLRPGTPFIFFSGTIGEEIAIDALKDGATDYVLKQRPQRLIAAIRRALADREERERMQKAEQQIRAQAEVIDLATDAIVIRRLDDTIEFINHGAERLYGFSRSELLGRNAAEFISPSLLNHFREVKEATLRDGHWEGEMEQHTKAQRPLLVTSRWTLVSDPHLGDRILEINTDITEKKQLEKQFLRAQRLESIGTLASGIAHDLNNILAPIFMATELLRQNRPSPESDAMLGIIEQSARRGAEIVKQVLTFVRGGEGRRVLFSAEPIIKEVAKMARETFPRNISTSYSIDPKSPPIRGDAGQLYQVLMNLCVNARDALPNGGKLSISSLCNGPDLVIRVEDTGTGIPPALLDKIFDPFFTTKELANGTGLGLSTVMGIIKSHGGRIHVQSTPGKGTCFEITLPGEIALAEKQPVANAAIPDGNGELILLVDDEPEVRHLTAQALLQHGYEVLSAVEGNEAIVKFTERMADVRLVITDVMMPGVDGASLARTLRAMKPNVPVIATTGLSEETIPEARFLLKKPFPVEDLLRLVAETLPTGEQRPV